MLLTEIAPFDSCAIPATTFWSEGILIAALDWLIEAGCGVVEIDTGTWADINALLDEPARA